MYENALKDIPKDEWKKGEHHNLVPVVILLHSIETSDFYTNDSAKFEWGYRFNVSWSESDPLDFPSKDELREYFMEVKDQTVNWLSAYSDDGFLEVDPFPYNTGKGRLGRVLYLLSHLRQHMGELNAELRYRGLSRVVWK